MQLIEIDLALGFQVPKQGENCSSLQFYAEFIEEEQIEVFAKNQEGVFPWVLIKMM